MHATRFNLPRPRRTSHPTIPEVAMCPLLVGNTHEPLPGMQQAIKGLIEHETGVLSLPVPCREGWLR